MIFGILIRFYIFRDSKLLQYKVSLNVGLIEPQDKEIARSPHEINITEGRNFYYYDVKIKK